MPRRKTIATVITRIENAKNPAEWAFGGVYTGCITAFSWLERRAPARVRDRRVYRRRAGARRASRAPRCARHATARAIARALRRLRSAPARDSGSRAETSRDRRTGRCDA